MGSAPAALVSFITVQPVKLAAAFAVAKAVPAVITHREF